MSIQTEVSELILKADATAIDEAKKSLDSLALSASDVSRKTTQMADSFSASSIGGFANASRTSAAAIHEWQQALANSELNAVRSIELNSALADRMRKMASEASNTGSKIKEDLNKGLQQLVAASEDGANATGRLGQMFGVAKSMLAGLVDGVSKGSGEMLVLASRLELAGAGFIAVAGAGGVFLKQMFDFAAPTAQFSDDIGKMASRLGMTAEAYSLMKPALDDAGIGIQTFTRGLVEMGQSIDKIGTKKGEELAGLFDRIGLSATELRQMGADRQFAEIADAISKIEDPAERVSAAVAIFGERLGPQLMPILKDGKDGLDSWAESAIESGLAVSELEAKLGDDLGDSLTKIGGLFSGIKENAVKPFIGELANLATVIYDNIKKTGAITAATYTLAGAFGVVLTLAQTLATVFVGVATIFDVVGKSIASVALAAYEAAQGNWRNAWEALRMGGDDVVESTKKAASDIAKIWEGVDEKLVKNADSLKNSFTATAEATAGVANGAKVTAEELDGLRVKYDTTYASQKEFLKGVQELDTLLANGAFGEGAAAQAEYERQLELLTIRIEKMDEPVKRVTASTHKLTEAQKEQLRIAKEAQKEAEKERKARLALDKEDEKRVKNLYKAVEADEAEVKAMQLKLDLLREGKTTQYDYNIAVLEGELATLDFSKATIDDVVALERRIAAQKELKRIAEEGDAFKANAEAASAATKQFEDDWNSTMETIDQTFHDGFVSMLEHGKSAWKSFSQSLVNTFKSMVADQLYKAFLQMPVQGIAASLMGGMSGGASAGGMGMAGTALNGASLYSKFAGYGTNLLSYGMFGTNAASAVAGNTVMAGSAQEAMLASQGMGGYSAVIPGAAWAGGLGGALYGYQKGGVRGGVIGGVAGYVGGYALAGGASALAAGGGLAAAGGGAMAGGAAALASIPGWGWAALAALAIFGGGKKKPSDKAAWGDIDLGTGEYSNIGTMTGKKFSQENNDFRDAVLDATSAWSAGLKEFGATLTGSIHFGIGDRDGLRADMDGDGVNEIKETDTETFMRKVFDAITEGATGLDSTVKDLLLSFDGTTEELMAFSGALITIQDYIDSDVLEDVLTAIDDASMTLFDHWQAGKTNVEELAASFDGSVLSAQNLAAAVQSQYEMEFALIAQIKQMLGETHAMFSGSIETIQLSVMKEEERYDFFRSKADEAYANLQTATDPALIAQYSSDVNRYGMLAWNSLDETQQAGASAEYIDYFTAADQLAEDRYDSVEETIIAGHDDLVTKIKDVMVDVAATMKEAALTPQTVNVNVDVAVDTPADVEVYMPGPSG